ncbi:MAG TPA: hypothetical protein VM618_13320 [Acidimicrobiia bacterium]|nr:hypothetical protein [Acidimicrobiia bacterium]
MPTRLLRTTVLTVASGLAVLGLTAGPAHAAPVGVAQCVAADQHVPAPFPAQGCVRASHPGETNPTAMPSFDSCVLVETFDACAASTIGGYAQQVAGVCAGYLGEYRRACVNGPDGCGVNAMGVRLLPSGSCGQ